MSESQLTTSDFETWTNNFVENEDIRANIYQHLRKEGQTDSDFSTWINNISSGQPGGQKQRQYTEEEKDIIEEKENNPYYIFAQTLRKAKKAEREKRAETDPDYVDPEKLWGEGKWYQRLPYKLKVSASELAKDLNNPLTYLQWMNYGAAIGQDVPVRLRNVLEQTKLSGVEFIERMTPEGIDTFLEGFDKTKLENRAIIDPETGDEIVFNKEAHDKALKAGKDFAVENQRWYELTDADPLAPIGAHSARVPKKGVEFVYRDNKEEIGKATDLWLIDKYKEIETRKLKYLYDGKGMVAGFKSGDAGEAVGGVINSIVSMAETMGPAALTRGLSLFPHITAPMVSDYNVEKAKLKYGDTPDAIEKLVNNNETEVITPLTMGVLATGLEYIGFKGITNAIAAKAVKGGAGAKLANMLWAGQGEGWTELGQHAIETANISFAKGKTIEEASADAANAMFSEQGLEMWLSGFVGGSTMAGGGMAIRSAFNSTGSSVKEINGMISDLAKLHQNLYSTKDPDVKKDILQDISVAEKKLTDYILEKEKLNSFLNEDQKAELVRSLASKKSIKEKINKLYDKLQKNQITKKEFGYSLRSLTNQDKRLTETIERINEEAKQQSLVSNLEVVKEQAEELGMEQKLVQTKEEYALMFGKKGSKKYKEALLADGHISEDGNTFFVNMEIAREAGAIGVGSHELLHGIIGKSFSKLSTEAKKKLNKQFLNLLSTRDKAAVLNRLAGSYGIKGEAVFTTEELYTAFSDEIIDGGVQFDEGVFGKIKNVIEEVLRKLSEAGYFSQDGATKFLYRKEFGNARQAYNFVKDYSLTIKKTGKVTERAKAFAKIDPGSEAGKQSRSKLIDDINDLQQGATDKAEFQSKPIFDPVFKAIQPGGMINNYIRSLGMSVEKTQETIDAVTDRLINFDPAAKRKDGTTVGPKGLGEFIMANVGFGKLVAAKKLAVKAKKRTTTLDDPGVESSKTPTPMVKKKEVKTKLKQRKSRQLTSLADLDIESSPLIKAVSKIQLKKLIKLNPKNLIEEIQKTLVPDLVEIIRKEMGVVGQKDGKLNIPDTYLAYLSDTYRMTISSMEISKIRANYKNLFKKEKMGFADYKTLKTDKPSLKKDSNYVKDINRNITTKAEFIKFHTEGKKNKLIANQRNLAIMRAEAEAVRAAENYIIENSTNLNEVYGAELRNFIDSKTTEKQKLEDKSFDSVLFSKTMASAAFEIRDGVLTGKNVFDNNGNLIGDYKNILKNKKDSKAVGDFVWGNLDLLSPETDFKFLRKAYEKLYKSGDRGTAYEKNLIQTIKNAEKIYGKEAIEAVLREPTETDALPDMIIKIHDKVMNIEAKMANAQYSSVTNAIVNGLMTIKKQYSPEFMSILTNLQKESQKGITKAQKFLKSKGIEWNNIKEISTEGHNMLLNNIDPETGSSYFNGMSATLPLPLKFIAEIYNNKKHKVHLMQLMGRGLFSMGGDIFNLGIPALEDGGDGFITLRIGSNSKKETVTMQEGVKAKIKTGMKSYSYRSIPGITNEVLNSMKSNHNVESMAGIMKLMDSNEVSNLRQSRTVEAANTLNKGVMFSRTVNEPKGITVLDFDDTLATTKSGVRAKIPNPDRTPKPGRKAILLAGGAGSGKSNVVKQLGLENSGFKIVNQDIALEWLKKNAGIPTDMRDLTKEQLSTLGKLGYEARMIAKRKYGKFKGKGDGVVVDGTGGSVKTIKTQKAELEAAGYDVQMLFVETSLDVALERNRNRKERSLKDIIVERNHAAVQKNKAEFKEIFGNGFTEVNTDKLKQNDPMPSNVTDKINNFVNSYEKRRLDAEEFALQGADILEKGGEFDFSEFNIVVEGQTAPLFNKALKLQKKFGTKDMFVLTARPAESAPHIFEFLKANGLNIPLENITGLANSTPEAKALWMADKVGDGYNDFYFADDALQNVQAVQNVLDQMDVKSKVQQAKVKFSKSMSNDFNNVLEDVTGIDSKKRYSQAKARKRGKGKGRFRFFIPPSHEDFVGLLYNFIGKGEKGNKHRDFFEKALVKPLDRAYQELTAAKQSIANDYKNLVKKMPDIRKKLTKKTPDGDYRYEDAVRVYLWDKNGFDIPGMSKTDIKELTDLVNADPRLKSFADTIGKISRLDDGYTEPGENWEASSIKQDLADATGRVGRAKFFAEFIENADIIFDEANLNKIEAAYGKNFREALEDMLKRIKTGTNRRVGKNKMVNNFLDYLNGSIGATMFFNARSAVLQTLSTVNFINFGDNNIFKAAAAFANQKQFWKDFAMIFNSDVLKQRRAGGEFRLDANEIATKVGKANSITGKIRAATNHLLSIGFLPTQIADSFAIALGGASYYRNRVNTYLKQGLSQKEAESKAFTDFQGISEETQQSARPDRLSQQQASVLGRLILAFQNTPSQYARLIKKAGLDLINRRKTPPYDSQVRSDMSNISRIIYYGAVQNIIFSALQSALFAIMFSEDDEEEDEKTQKFFDKKKDRVINNTIDTLLRGSGVAGAIVSTVKNAVIKYGQQQEKGWGKKLGVISDELLQLSPPIGIKARKLDSYERTMEFNKKVIPEMDTFDINNPMWSAYAQLVEGATNIPVARLLRKVENINAALDSENQWWQRVAVGLGWSKWDVGIENKELEAVKDRLKKEKSIKKRKNKRKTRPTR